MRHQSHSYAARVPIDAGRQVAQIRQLLRLVQELSGHASAPEAEDSALDEAARIAGQYAQAEPVVQRRFDILAKETAGWSAVAVEALLAAGEGRSHAAVTRLAEELDKSLTEISLLLQPARPLAASAIRSHEAIP